MAPDIASTIFEKIKAADIFVGDVSFINQGAAGRPTPNPNVLVEMGFAAGRLGWEKIICVFNKASGSINDLPFDIRPRRVRAYELVEDQEKTEQRTMMVSVFKSDITDILHAPEKAVVEALQQMLSSLASELISIIILGDELDDRQIDPWFGSLRYECGATAHRLRDIASSDPAIRKNIAGDLEGLADALDEAATLQMHLGAWPQFEGLMKSVVEKATAIKQAHIDCVPLSKDSLSDVGSTITTIQRKLAGFASRAEDKASKGRLDDLQSEPSQLGARLLRLSHYNIDPIQPGLTQKVRQVGRELHLIETMQVYMDGGISIQAIVDRIKKTSGELTALVTTLNPQS